MLTIEKLNVDEDTDTKNLRDFDDVNLFFKQYDEYFVSRQSLFSAYDIMLEQLSPHNLNYDQIVWVLRMTGPSVSITCVNQKFLNTFLNTDKSELIVKMSDVLLKITN